MADIQQELAKLLGREALQIRKTREEPPRISVIDLATAITQKDATNAARDVGAVRERHPEVSQNLSDFKFPGRGQRETPVANIRGAVELVLLLPGRHAAQVRRQAASLLVRYLGGDIALVNEVCRIRGLQEELAVQRPEDPRRIFGEAVEAASTDGGAVVGEQLARLCTDIVARTLPSVLEKITAHIDERLAHLESMQRVNLNVRAPKRPAPYTRPIAAAVAGRPYPVAKGPPRPHGSPRVPGAPKASLGPNGPMAPKATREARRPIFFSAHKFCKRAGPKI